MAQCHAAAFFPGRRVSEPKSHERADVRHLGFLTVLVVAACTQVDIDFQPLPADDEFRSLRVGVTTRAEVLARLGPPEEFRRPSYAEAIRASTPQQRAILEGGRVFGRNVFTYASEHRRIRVFEIPPILPFLHWEHGSATEERWRIAFDENGVVESVSHIDEGEDE